MVLSGLAEDWPLLLRDQILYRLSPVNEPRNPDSHTVWPFSQRRQVRLKIPPREPDQYECLRHDAADQRAK